MYNSLYLAINNHLLLTSDTVPLYVLICIDIGLLKYFIRGGNVTRKMPMFYATL